MHVFLVIIVKIGRRLRIVLCISNTIFYYIIYWVSRYWGVSYILKSNKDGDIHYD